MSTFLTRLRKVRGKWVLGVTTPQGRRVADYEFSSLAQARFYAAVLSLGPRRLPPPPPRKPRPRSSAHGQVVGEDLTSALQRLTA